MKFQQNTECVGLTDRLRTFQKILSNVEVTDDEGRSLPLDHAADRAVDMLDTIASRKKTVYLVGNGGSASIVSHMQNDLAIGLGVKAQLFNEAPLLTALANDYGYEAAFEKVTRAWIETGDLLFTISSSGQSRNILNTVRVAHERNCAVVTFTGFSETNDLRHQGLVNFYVPASEYGYVESAHQALTHFITDEAIKQHGGKEID